MRSQNPSKCSGQQPSATAGRNRHKVQRLLPVLFAIFLGGSSRAAIPADDEAHQSGQSIIYVGNAAHGITEVNSADNSIIATAPFTGDVTGVAVTPDGRRLYAANADAAQVLVIDTATNVPLASISVGLPGEHRSLAVSPDGAFVYVTSQSANTLVLIATATNTTVKTIPMDGEPIWVTFSPDGSRAYVSNQTGGDVSVISTAAQAVIGKVPGLSLPFHSAFTRDGRFLFVSSQGDNSVKVVNPHTNAVVKTIPVGPIPRKIVFSPDGTRAYVTNFGGNAVDILDVWRQINLGTPITVGSAPWGMVMTPEGVAYVANFNDDTISVINSSTNTVAATLRARRFPQEVTLSTRAKPLVLNYDFVTFDGSPDARITNARDINAWGTVVGFYRNSTGDHGFLRSANGAIAPIDLPGAAATQPLGINDLGVIVGAYLDSNGAAHGFRRTPNGAFTTTDFPGAVDTDIFDINNLGDLVGAYDFAGDAYFGFVKRGGAITTLEDPDAVPGRTQVNGINDFGVTCGLYENPAGVFHSFIQRGANFTTVSFPFADETLLFGINNFSAFAGDYTTTSPRHGFVFEDGKFLSLDVPNSDWTLARGINQRGQVVGRYRNDASGPAHGFIATPKVEH